MLPFLGPLAFWLLLFVFCFLVYLVPFMGPSTMVLSGAVAAMSPSRLPIMIALVVSLSASLAKTVVYYVSFFLGRRFLGDGTFSRLQSYGRVMGRWKGFAVFLASATPIPDEPVVVATSLVRYDPFRFFVWFLLGKLAVTIPAAYMGRNVGSIAASRFGDTATMIGCAFYSDCDRGSSQS